MKILYVTWLDSATTDYPLFLSKTWERLGQKVQLFPYDLEHSSRLSTKFWQALGINGNRFHYAILEKRVDRACSIFRPDVLLLGGSFIQPKGISYLRKKYDCIVGYVVGYNVLLLDSNAQAMSVCDFVIVHDSYLIPVLKGQGYGKNPNVFWRPAAADPVEHFPLSLSKTDKLWYGCDIAFIGGISRNRVEALCRLTNYDLRIWGGYEWGNVPELAPFYKDESVYGLKKSKIYSAARIVLNIEHIDKQINSVSERVPEVLACGGFVLTEWRKDLEALGLHDDISECIFHDLDEMEEKVAYFLLNSDKRLALSQKGRQIVLENLTYDHSGPVLLKQIASVLQMKKRYQ